MYRGKVVAHLNAPTSHLLQNLVPLFGGVIYRQPDGKRARLVLNGLFPRPLLLYKQRRAGSPSADCQSSNDSGIHSSVGDPMFSAAIY